jgi:hypothetical protein
MKPWRRRVAQFFGALTARVRPEDMVAISNYLEPQQMALFRRMSLWDQSHSLNVFARLRAAGQTDSELLQAALLHDAGKSLAPVTVWHRVFVVLLASVNKSALKRISTNDSTWGAPISALVGHSESGARLAGEAGCSALVQEYICQHDKPSATGSVLWLKWADGQIIAKGEEALCPGLPSSEQA